eukprot:10952485-Ditylum_brightwellii.AAC.1
MKRSKQYEDVVCNKDDNFDNGVDNDIDNGDDVVDDVDDGADKQITHLSQAADCCLMERSKQNKH